jgi:non-haem Fe2+, alpha-ketoglutarate-dependent halogenase
VATQNTGPGICDVDDYKRRGFIPSVKVLDQLPARKFAADFDDFLRREDIDLGAPRFLLHDRHIDHDFIWDVATNSALLDVIAEITGPDVLILGSRFIGKPPHSALGVPWHRDATFAGLEPARQVNVWLAVDDVDLDNGCLRVLPKDAARQAGTAKHVPAQRSAGNLVDQQLSLTSEECAALVPLPLRSGFMTVFDGDLVHGSDSNSSSRRRCGFALRYTSAQTRLLNPGQWAAVCVRGTADDQDGRVVTRDGARTFPYRKVTKFDSAQ